MLGDVLGIGDGLESVGQRGREQVLSQQSLCRGPEALATVLWEEQDADL
jgi:hypothetical protein